MTHGTDLDPNKLLLEAGPRRVQPGSVRSQPTHRHLIDSDTSLYYPALV